MATAARILFHSPSRRGLGHVMRGANLARAVVAADPASTVVMHVANAAAGMACGDDVPYITADPATPGQWARVLDTARPSLVVFDTLLPGPWADDATPRAFVWRHSVPERHHEVLRDPRLDAMHPIIVPHTREEFGYDLPPSVEARAVFTGPIVRDTDAAGQARVRARYGLAPTDIVITSTVGGGGFDASAAWLLDVVTAAHEELLSRVPRLRHIVVRGPLAARDGPAERPGLTVVDADPDLVHLLALSSLVVSEAGYNTIHELRRVHTPALLLPGDRTYDDQLGRASALEALGMARVVTRASQADAVAALLALVLDAPARAHMRAASVASPLETGNARAAAALLEAVR